MKQLASVRHGARWMRWIGAAAAVWILLIAAAEAASRRRIPGTTEDLEPNQQNPAQSSKDAALKEFQRRLNEYIKLRSELAKKVEPIRSTASASELAARQEALAAGLRTARAGAKRGDLIPTPVAEEIRTIVAADFSRRSVDARRAAVEGVPEGLTLAINRTYPQQAALPTVPPLLLSKLPVLPDNLQYRFVNRHMVILDGDTQMIVDYIADVLPAR